MFIIDEIQDDENTMPEEEKEINSNPESESAIHILLLKKHWPANYGIIQYSGTSPYDHLTSKKTSPLQSPWLSPKLYSTVQITHSNKVTSPLRSLLPNPVGDLNSEVPLYHSKHVQSIVVIKAIK